MTTLTLSLEELKNVLSMLPKLLEEVAWETSVPDEIGTWSKEALSLTDASDDFII